MDFGMPKVKRERRGNSLIIVIENYFKEEIVKPNVSLTDIFNSFNEILGDQLGHAPMTVASHNAAMITSSINTEGMENVSDWINYFNQVNESDFLMGRVTNFKASLLFLLKKETILKLKLGAYNNFDSSSIIDKQNIKKAISGQYRSVSECDFLNDTEKDLIIDNGGILALGRVSSYEFDRIFKNSFVRSDKIPIKK